MVRLLVRLERCQFLRVDPDVVPVDVELGIGVVALGHTPAHHLLGHLFDQGIVSLYTQGAKGK